MSEYSSPAVLELILLEEETSSVVSPGSPYVQLVNKSLSDRLLGKFFDASEFDFEYEQSELWSPLIIPHKVFFISSPAGKIYSIDKMLKKMNNSRGTFYQRCINCFNGFWCF